MQYYKIIVLSAVVLLSTQACKKSNGSLVSPASVNVINAMPNSNPIIPVFGTFDSIQYFGTAQTVGYTNIQLYSPMSGANMLYIVQNTDTTLLDLKQPLFKGVLNLIPGGIYSFFIAGDTTAPDTLFVKDNIPPYYSDSLAGVRFVNLSTGSQPMSITIEGNPVSQAEFTGLSYKSLSSFKTYAANSSISNSSYLFIVRDQATGDSLTSYTWNYTLFKNNTLIITGSEGVGATTPLQVFQMNNY